MKKLILFTVLISIVTLASFWGGKKMCMLMWPGSVNPSQNWYYALGLNSEQAEFLKKLDGSFRQDTDKLCMTICKERLDLLNLMKDKSTGQEVVYRKIEKIGELQILLEKQIASHILKVKNDLTPEQSQAYLNRIHEELRQSIIKSGYGEVLNQ